MSEGSRRRGILFRQMQQLLANLSPRHAVRLAWLLLAIAIAACNPGDNGGGGGVPGY